MPWSTRRNGAVDLSEYLDILRRRWVAVLVIALTTLALASAATLAMPKKYTAVTRLFISVAGESVSELAQGSSFAEKQMASYAEVATSPRVLAPVIDELGLPVTPQELAELVEVTVPVDTVILEIAATDQDPTLAAQIANAVGMELSKAAADLSAERQDGTKAIQAHTVTPAQVPTEPSSPKILQN